MILDQLIVLFGEQGAKDVLKSVKDIDKAVSKSLTSFAKAKAKASVIEAKAVAQVDSIAKSASIRLHKESIKQQDSHIKLYKQYSKWKEKNARDTKRRAKDEERSEQRLEKARIDRRRKEIMYANMFDKIERKDVLDSEQAHNELINQRILLIGKLGATALIVGKSMQKMYGYTGDATKRGLIYSGRYAQTGMSASQAESFDRAVQMQGGELGEGQSLLANITGQIGAMRYGDTGLVEKLGKYGIGGIGAHSKTEDVIRAISRRAQGMDAYAQQAMFQEFGLSDAVQRLIREGGLDKALAEGKTPLTTSDEQKKAYQERIEAERKTLQAQQEISTKLSSIDTLLSKLIQEYPTLTEAIKELTPLVASLAGIKIAETAFSKNGKASRLGDFLKTSLRWGSIATGLTVAGSIWGASEIADKYVSASYVSEQSKRNYVLGMGAGMAGWNEYRNANKVAPISNNSTVGDTTNNNQTYNNTTNYNVQGEPFMGGQSGMDILLGNAFPQNDTIINSVF